MPDLIPEDYIPLTEVGQLYFDQLWRGGTPVDELRQRVRGKDILPDVAHDHLERLKHLENLEWQGLLQPFFEGRLEALVRLPGETGNFAIPKSAWAEMFYPERPFLADEIGLGHGDYWNAIIGSIPFVRRVVFNDWLSAGHSTIGKLIGHQAKLYNLLQDIMLGLAQDGLAKPDELEDMAARWGLWPFARTPDATQFNPMDQAIWSLPMTLAWLIWRTPEAVRDEWDPYRDACWNWQGFEIRKAIGHGEAYGYELVNRAPATVRALSLSEAEAEVGEHQDLYMTVKSAREALWNGLSSGSIVAHATDANGNIVTIPAREWSYLDLSHRVHGADYLTSNRLLNGAKYFDLTFERKTVMRLWKPKLAPEKEFSSGQVFAFPSGEQYWSLFEAAVWVGTEGQTLTTDEIEDRALDDIGANLLFAALNRKTVNASGINRHLLREPIPHEYWELATLDPATAGHSVSFVDDAGGGLWGTLTPSGDDEPRWSRINIEASALKKAFPFAKSKPDSCRKWLESEMRDSPNQRPQTKAEFHSTAKKRFNVKSADFERAWVGALENVPEAKPFWTRGGRPKKQAE